MSVVSDAPEYAIWEEFAAIAPKPLANCLVESLTPVLEIIGCCEIFQHNFNISVSGDSVTSFTADVSVAARKNKFNLFQLAYLFGLAKKINYTSLDHYKMFSSTKINLRGGRLSLTIKVNEDKDHNYGGDVVMVIDVDGHEERFIQKIAHGKGRYY